jgi:hypothetical protein
MVQLLNSCSLDACTLNVHRYSALKICKRRNNLLLLTIHHKEEQIVKMYVNGQVDSYVKVLFFHLWSGSVNCKYNAYCLFQREYFWLSRPKDQVILHCCQADHVLWHLLLRQSDSRQVWGGPGENLPYVSLYCQLTVWWPSVEPCILGCTTCAYTQPVLIYIFKKEFCGMCPWQATPCWWRLLSSGMWHHVVW